MEIRLSDQIIPKIQPIFRTTKKHVIITSGRAGTKSSAAAIDAVWTIIQPKPASVVVLRKHHIKLRKTVYKEILRAISRLNLPKNKFKITVSPMEITYIPTGNSIFFSGSDSIDDTKGLIDEERPIKLVMLDELTEFFNQGEGEDELQNIEATFVRGNAGGFTMLYLYNPPKNPNAPIQTWLDYMRHRPDTLHIHCDYRDVPPEWLGEDLITSAEVMRDYDPQQYSWVWLGQSIGINELIFYMFDKEKHVKEPSQDSYKIIGIGCDYGQQNATAYEAAGLNTQSKMLEGLDEYYYSGRDTGKQKSPSDYAHDFRLFCDDLSETYNCREFFVFIDPSAAGFIEQVKREIIGAPYAVHIKKAENAVALGISRVQDLLTYDILHISPKQKNLITEFGLYEYDKKSIERGKEVPVKINDHCLTGDTIVETTDGPIPIKDLCGKTGKVYCWNKWLKRRTAAFFHDVRKTQENAEIYEVTLQNGDKITGTGEHKVLTKNGWKMIKDLNECDAICNVS